jgi:hypothetical protein
VESTKPTLNQHCWYVHLHFVFNVLDISLATLMTFDDVVTTLDLLGMLKKIEKNRFHVVLNIAALERHVEKLRKKQEAGQLPRVDMTKLKWQPFLARLRGPSALPKRNSVAQDDAMQE